MHHNTTVIYEEYVINDSKSAQKCDALLQFFVSLVNAIELCSESRYSVFSVVQSWQRGTYLANTVIAKQPALHRGFSRWRCRTTHATWFSAVCPRLQQSRTKQCWMMQVSLKWLSQVKQHSIFIVRSVNNVCAELNTSDSCGSAFCYRLH